MGIIVTVFSSDFELEVTREDGYYDAHILWGGGSVLPVDSVVFPNRNTLMITRSKTVKRKDAQGEVTRTQRFVDTIRARMVSTKRCVRVTSPWASLRFTVFERVIIKVFLLGKTTESTGSTLPPPQRIWAS